MKCGGTNTATTTPSQSPWNLKVGMRWLLPPVLYMEQRQRLLGPGVHGCLIEQCLAGQRLLEHFGQFFRRLRTQWPQSLLSCTHLPFL